MRRHPRPVTNVNLLLCRKDLNLIKANGSKSSILRAPEKFYMLDVHTTTKAGTSSEQTSDSQKVGECS